MSACCVDVVINRTVSTRSVALLGRAVPLLRLINAARLFPHLPRHPAAACVTELQLHRPRLRVSLSAVTGTPLSSVMEKINSSGTEDGERLIIELMITSHSHEFTQIMQMKSFHE